ncbi:MAG: hypothetical protein NXH84_01785 [Rhodobacteraceae bacterium]|jgi:hypothetical protein|nr:hypothetical protein [Paracoccaceae bacterium]
MRVTCTVPGPARHIPPTPRDELLGVALSGSISAEMLIEHLLDRLREDRT